VPADLDDLVGTAGRAIAWMHHALDTQVAQRRASREFAAQELENMQAILHLLEDLRHGAQAAPQVQLSLERAKARRRA